MSYEVSHAFWHFWRPGMRYEPEAHELAQYRRYVARASRRGNVYRLCMLALALDANALEPADGVSEVAECTTPLDTLAERLGVSRRTTQRVIVELKDYNEIGVRYCNGSCKFGRHGGSNHYYLALPEGAQPWKRKTRRETRKQTEKRENV